MNKILLYGFYNKGNVGDELFIDSFKTMFPEVIFTIVDKITLVDLKAHDTIFIGGGSLLEDDPSKEEDLDNILLSKNIFYIGVGAETSISFYHQRLMKIAKLIILRSDINFKLVKELNDNVYIYPDLVYSLLHKIKASTEKVKNSILVIPNAEVIPNLSDENWKHAAWNYFKSEFCQFIDDTTFKIDFLGFCKNKNINDDYAAAELINFITYKNSNIVTLPKIDIETVSSVMSQYDFIITQRFHGAILADMLNIPCMIISHHDKLNHIDDQYLINYYEVSKKKLNSTFTKMLNNNRTSIPLKSNIFVELKEKIITLIPGQIYHDPIYRSKKQ